MKILFLSHHGSMKGAFDALYDYVKEKTQNATALLSQPLPGSSSEYIYVHLNQIEKEKKLNATKGSLVSDFIRGVMFVARYRPDVTFAANNFDAVSAIVGKKLSFNKTRVVYYGSDFSLNRFANPILNAIYIYIEKYALKKSDIIIANTQRAATQRQVLGAIGNKMLVVSNSVLLPEIKFPEKIYNPRIVVYVGNINPEHGLLEFIKSAPRGLFQELIVYGLGSDEFALHEACETKKIKLIMKGLRPKGEILEFLQNFNGFGLAPYRLKNSVHALYGSPLKIIEYVSACVPVITSTTTELSERISTEHLGIVYDDLNGDKMESLILSFPSQNYSKRAKLFYEEFNTKKVFGSLLRKLTERGIAI
jgi:glycosyltransferase involved in cell wall biosynthesis